MNAPRNMTLPPLDYEATMTSLWGEVSIAYDLVHPIIILKMFEIYDVRVIVTI